MSTFNTRCHLATALTVCQKSALPKAQIVANAKVHYSMAHQLKVPKPIFPRCCKATNLSSSIFGHHGVTLVSASHRFLVMLPPSEKARSAA